MTELLQKGLTTAWLPTLAAVAVLAAILAAPGAAFGGEARLYGEPQVMEFKDGKRAAFTLQFDDSMTSQAEFAIPEMNKRGLVGTFFVNPALDRYQQHRETWEKVCPQCGHELANHTMHHQGAKDFAEADYEIGECSRHIWRLYPNRSKMLPFARGGGTTWGISREQIQELMRKYLLYSRPRGQSISDEGGTAERILTYPAQALAEGAWVLVYFHGIGGEWISTSRERFLELLDYLVAHRDQLWITTTGDGYKYQQAYQAVSRVAITDARADGYTVALECDEHKVETYGLPFTELYDQPLTIRNRVPDSWSRFSVRQGDNTREYQVVEVGGQRYAQYELLPNAGEAAVARLE